MSDDPIVSTVLRRTRPDWREVALVVGVTGVFAVGYLLLARANGALGIPRGDDWAYYRVAFEFSRSGHLRLVNFGQMALVGQIVLAAPVLAIWGRSMTALAVMVAAMGAAAVVCSYLLLRSFLEARWAALCCAVLLVGPIFGSVSVSFMTDVPAYFMQALTLLIGWRAVSRSKVSLSWLAASAVIGLVAASIRDNGALAFGAVGLIALAKAWSSGDQERLRGALALLVGFSVIGLVLLGWAHSLPHAEPTTLGLHLDVTHKVARTVLTLALFISPCVLAVSPRRLLGAVAHTDRWLQLVFGLATAGLLVLRSGDFIGNYFQTAASVQPAQLPFGGSSPVIIPHHLFQALLLLAVYAVVVIMGVLLVAAQAGLGFARDHGLRRLVADVAAPSSAIALVSVFLLASGLVQSVSMAVSDIPLFDRYLIGLIPFAAGLLIAFTQAEGLGVAGPGRGLVVVGLVGLALLGLLMVDASATTDGLKWALAERAQTLGYQPATIDGGYQWFAFHQSGPVTDLHPVGTISRPYWVDIFPPRRVCVSVGVVDHRGPVASMPVLATRSATTLFGQRLVYVLRPGPDRCQPTRR